MAFCTKCGSTLTEGVSFCTSCGNKISEVKAAAVGSAITTIDAASPSPAPLWHVTYATGQTGGPFTEGEVRGMIARQEIKITDAVAVHGSSAWLPITQSPFAPFVAVQTSMDRLASTTCPQCGGAMAVVLRRSGASKAFLTIGLLTIWMFGFGIIFLILGYITGRSPTPRYECPRCKYKAR